MPLKPEDLVGAWELDDWYIEGADGRRRQPFGSDATGVILYTADGYMAAIIRARGRTLAAERPTDAQRAAAFKTYVNYAGSWTVDGDTVRHIIEHALVPNIEGDEVIRKVHLDGGRLTLTGAPPGGGGDTHVVVWKRR